MFKGLGSLPHLRKTKTFDKSEKKMSLDRHHQNMVFVLFLALSTPSAIQGTNVLGMKYGIYKRYQKVKSLIFCLKIILREIVNDTKYDCHQIILISSKV